MRKLRLYLETSVWNYLFDDIQAEKREVTNRLLEAVGKGKYEACISELVLLEIHNTKDEQKRQNMRDALKKYEPVVLELNRESIALATLYTDEGVLTINHWHDAVHVATASVEEVDVVVSWNLEDLVRYKTRKGVEGINLLHGYRRIDICTPQEVIGHEE